MADGNYLALKCGHCATAFSWLRPAGTRGRNRKFCSPACADLEGRREKYTVPCRTCGVDFRPVRVGRNQSPQVVCSMSCRRWPSAQVYPTVQERIAAAGDRRRCRKRGTGYERFMRREIYERDGWACQLCGDPVDRTGADKHLRASLDHKVPLARGGVHSRANVQCAHWICNSRKSHHPGANPLAPPMRSD